MALNIKRLVNFSYTKCSDKKAEALFKGNILRDYVCLYAVASRLATKLDMLNNPKLTVLQSRLEYISRAFRADENSLRKAMEVMSREESETKQLKELERKYPS